MRTLLRLTLLLTTLLVQAATAQPIQDDVATGSDSSGTSVISSSLPVLPSLTSEDGDQAVLIRQRRSWTKTRSPYCRTARGLLRCRQWKRKPWKPSYLVSTQDRNDPINYGIGSRKTNNGHEEENYVPKRSDSNTVYVPKPIMHIENPKPISHPKKSKGAIRKIA